MAEASPRIGARALVVEGGRLLLVNAFADPGRDLWCAPGGGAEAGEDLPAGLAREVREETGLKIEVGDALAVAELWWEEGRFHQVDIYFAARALGPLPRDWTDPERVVHRRGFFAPEEVAAMRVAPDFLPDLAFGSAPRPVYRGLRPMVR